MPVVNKDEIGINPAQHAQEVGVAGFVLRSLPLWSLLTIVSIWKSRNETDVIDMPVIWGAGTTVVMCLLLWGMHIQIFRNVRRVDDGSRSTIPDSLFLMVICYGSSKFLSWICSVAELGPETLLSLLGTSYGQLAIWGVILALPFRDAIFSADDGLECEDPGEDIKSMNDQENQAERIAEHSAEEHDGETDQVSVGEFVNMAAIEAVAGILMKGVFIVWLYSFAGHVISSVADQGFDLIGFLTSFEVTIQRK